MEESSAGTARGEGGCLARAACLWLSDEDPHSFLTHKGAARDISQCPRKECKKHRLPNLTWTGLRAQWKAHSPVVQVAKGGHELRLMAKHKMCRGSWELSANLHLRPRWELKGLSGDLAGATPVCGTRAGDWWTFVGPLSFLQF